MASVQARRENVTDERSTAVEKDRVPKMATHFESLAVRAREEPQYVPFHGERQVGSGIQVSGAGESDSERKIRDERRNEAQKQVDGGVPLEEISNLRATALQNSDNAIIAAEERYEKAKAAKGAAADNTESAAGDVGEKVVAGEDAAVESGEGAAGFVGKVAAKVKDHAVVAGWGTAQYTPATKVAADITSSVAGYTGEKAAAAKDKVAGVGKTVVSYAGEKIAAATDAVVVAEEKAAEYAARKQAEAQEARKESREMGNGEERKEQVEAPPENLQEIFDEGAPRQWQGGSILRAIGETIVEIGQTTKALLIGQKDEAEFAKEHYPEAGRGT